MIRVDLGRCRRSLIGVGVVGGAELSGVVETDTSLSTTSGCEIATSWATNRRRRVPDDSGAATESADHVGGVSASEEIVTGAALASTSVAAFVR